MSKFSLKFDLVSYRVYITLPTNYELDLRTGDFNKLIGYSKKIINASLKGDLLLDITKSIDDIQIGCSLLSDSIVLGKLDDVFIHLVQLILQVLILLLKNLNIYYGQK